MTVSPPVTAGDSTARDRRRARLDAGIAWAGRILAGGIALLLLFLAAHMDRQWAERHLLPDILVPTAWLMGIVQIERIILVVIALALLLSIRPRRMRARRPPSLQWVAITGAVLLALPASELAMQQITGRKGQPWTPTDEPLRQADPLVGWTFIPSRRIADPEYDWRPVYVVDAHGYRIADDSRTLDKAAPSILFAGESIMFGKGLNWPDTIAGQVQALSGVQSANLAVTAYSTSQTTLRLRRELPGFRQPLAVVILFAPTLLMRDLDRNRPWIDRDGQWHAAEPTWYLSRLGRVLFPYRSVAAIDNAVATDRRLLLANVAMVRARGAQPLVLVPIFQPEQPAERALRAAIFDGADIPHQIVPLDPQWRLLPDPHADARAHAAMAQATWSYLKEHLRAKAKTKNSVQR
jgi:hypothetical protein